MAALAASHQPRPVDRRFPIAASELPPTTQPLPLLAAVLRGRAILGSHHRPSCMAALAAGHQPSVACGPPLPDRSLRAATVAATAATSRSCATQPGSSGSHRRPSCMAALAAGHQQRPVDCRFPIAASELPTPTQPLPLFAAVVEHSLARVATRLAWRLWPPAISSGPWTAASRSQSPSCRRRHNRCHFSQLCFAAEHSLARMNRRPSCRWLWPPAISRGP